MGPAVAEAGPAADRAATTQPEGTCDEGNDNCGPRFGTGISYGTGTSGTYSRNMALECTTPYLGGTAGSDNNSSAG